MHAIAVSHARVRSIALLQSAHLSMPPCGLGLGLELCVHCKTCRAAPAAGWARLAARGFEAL